MGMTYRRRAFLGSQKTWKKLMNVVNNYYDSNGNLMNSSTVNYDIYVDFPISKLVGSSSEYVLAVYINDELIDFSQYGFYIIPRANIGTTNLNSVCIPYAKDAKGSVIVSNVWLSGEFNWNESISSSLKRISSSGGTTYYYINDENQVPIYNAYVISCYEEMGGGSSECPSGGNHNWELYLVTHIQCPSCGSGAEKYEYECTKCKEHLVLQNCPNGC